MKKDDLTDTVEDTSANPDTREKVFSLFQEEQGTPMSIRKRLVLGISAAVLVCVLGFALPPLLEAVDPAPVESQLTSESDTAETAEAPVAHAGTSSLFAVTAYTAEWKETVLQPKVSIALNEYSPAQSNVPGFAFIISVPEGTDNINADGIRIDVDTGTIVTWEPPDYTVRQRGKTYVCSSGTTIYWSPLDSEDAPISRCDMTITGYTGDDETFAQQIVIKQTKDFSYTAELQ